MTVESDKMIIDDQHDSLLELKNTIRSSLSLVEKSVSSLESRFTLRALRSIAVIRKDKGLALQVLKELLTSAQVSVGNETRDLILSFLSPDDTPMSTESKPLKESPEIDLYLALLLLVILFDDKKFDQALSLATSLISKYTAANRRTLDPLLARCFYFLSLLHEQNGTFSQTRPELLAAYRTACLRHDEDIQAALLNALLRNYLDSNLIDQADKLVSKTTFPESASNNQIARYMYYLGRIKAIQLDYSSAFQNLNQAIRKSPQGVAAAGFHQVATKLLVIVQLLMGEIPDRGTFRQPTLLKALIPYFHITQAVRVGNLQLFQETLATYGKTFREDKNLTLILRLRHNVIKAGVRRISLSYSRVSLRDICIKLGLDSEEDAEFIVAKSIRDGVIDAVIDHEKGWMKSSENPDIYSTNEPQSAFHQRIQFCLNLHNESVKALRFPSDAHRKDLSALTDQDRFATPEDVLDAVEDDEMADF